MANTEYFFFLWLILPYREVDTDKVWRTLVQVVASHSGRLSEIGCQFTYLYVSIEKKKLIFGIAFNFRTLNLFGNLGNLYLSNTNAETDSLPVR